MLAMSGKTSISYSRRRTLLFSRRPREEVKGLKEVRSK